jgi:predicted dehydrogenase
MGISHLAILGAHPDVDVVGVCDSQGMVTSALRSMTGIETFKESKKLFREVRPDCVVISTPSAAHYEAASLALEDDIHVFVEKPLTLDAAMSQRLAALAQSRRLANQVGYHYRFVASFRELRRLVQAGAIGEVHHIDGCAFGPVVTRPKSGFTWRSKKGEGGGCLHDYASHVIDLMNWIMGPPTSVLGARLRPVFSRDVEDTVHALFEYDGGASGRLHADWSDESYRKMTTSITVHGTKGKIVADRQECQVYLKSGETFEDYAEGWTTRYITDLQGPTSYYLRGEEYSTQIDDFVRNVRARDPRGENSFESAAATDHVIAQILACGTRKG